ncbi:hypothetical protein ABIC42_006935 [Variovorax sp. 1133]
MDQLTPAVAAEPASSAAAAMTPPTMYFENFERSRLI